MNEASFSRWLCKHLIKNCFMPQRLEVTTGAGIPDIAALGYSETKWIELKWETKHIRPEQFVWGTRAKNTADVMVNYVVGYEDRMELYFLFDIKKMTKSYKLTHLVGTFPRTPAGAVELIPLLR